MKPKETEEIYASACKAKRLVPQQDEGRMWHKTLSAFEAQDVKAALDAWWSSTETDSKGELKSKWLPAPGELIPLVERAQRKRIHELTTPKIYAAWFCTPCSLRFGGFIEPDDVKPRKCPSCGSVMAEIHREKAA